MLLAMPGMGALVLCPGAPQEMSMVKALVEGQVPSH